MPLTYESIKINYFNSSVLFLNYKHRIVLRIENIFLTNSFHKLPAFVRDFARGDFI